MKIISAIALACLFASPSLADVDVSFNEGAPKDTFVLTNVGTCDLATLQLTLDLTGSASGLIFDVTGSGPGVEVFQPFQIVSGQDLAASMPSVEDGDKSITLQLYKFGKGQSIAFTIDVDDTSGSREITVSNSEIRGATVTVTTSNGSFAAAFDETSQSKVSIPSCSA
jgi:hypothetical protein